MNLTVIDRFVYLGDDCIGELDWNVPGDEEPFLNMERVTLNAPALRELADFLDGLDE